MLEHSNLFQFDQLLFIPSAYFHLPSKSAIYVQTLEFKAFTTILRSVGPVISTLRSIKPGAGLAPFHASFSRMCLVSGRKSGSWPLSSSADTTLEKVFACAIEGSVEESEESKSILGEDLSVEVGDLAGDVHALENGFGGGHIGYLLTFEESSAVERGERCAGTGV